MQLKTSSRRLLIAAGLLLAFILLSGALRQFTLAPGLRIETKMADTLDEVFAAQERRPNPLGGETIGLVVSLVAGLSVVLFIVALVRRENRLSTLLAVVLGLLLAALLSNLVTKPQDELIPDIQAAMGNEAESAVGAGDLLAEEDAAEEDPEQDPVSWWWSAVVIIPAIIGMAVVLRPYLSPRSRETERDLGEVAREAAHAIESGRTLADVIQQCYSDMVDALEQSRSIKRRDSMTPREFEDRLIHEGLSPEDVSALTRLFEQSRYSTRATSPEEEAAAARHLRRIADSLGDKS